MWSLKALKILFPVLCLLSFLMARAEAQSDIKGSKDHPLLNRYPKSRITEYKKGFDELSLVLGKQEDGTESLSAMEGDVTRITYFHNKAEEQPSALQLLRNYQGAIKAIGGEVIYERKPSDNDGGTTTLKATQGTREFWIEVTPGIYSAPTQSYSLAILEKKALEQVVTANNLLDELNSKGFITLYVNFDTNKFNIKPEAQPIIDEVAKMLKSSANISISVEGHTDTVGSPESNKKLSANRAKSIVDALATNNVATNRMTSIGFGQEKPIAENSTEEGRAKNRRVEIVKK